MPDRKERAQLGEQVSDLNSTEEGRELEDRSASSHPSPDRSEERVARESTERNAEDSRSGDEGIDDTSLTRSATSGQGSSARENARKRDVRRDSSVRRDSARGSQTEFTGRGGQKESESEQAEGTGYTDDRSGQLQEDNSLSGTQGRHGTTGSRQGQDNRSGGQTAQNPRGSEVDRSLM